MVTIRRLTRQELYELINDAPDSETRNLKKYLYEIGMDVYDFFDKFSFEHFGMVNGRPLYFCCLVQNIDGQKEMITVVNTAVREQFSLYKHCKKYLKIWLDKHKEIWATMERESLKNRKWTERLGFRKFKEDDRTITYLLKENL